MSSTDLGFHTSCKLCLEAFIIRVCFNTALCPDCWWMLSHCACLHIFSVSQFALFQSHSVKERKITQCKYLLGWASLLYMENAACREHSVCNKSKSLLHHLKTNSWKKERNSQFFSLRKEKSTELTGGFYLFFWI